MMSETNRPSILPHEPDFTAPDGLVYRFDPFIKQIKVKTKAGGWSPVQKFPDTAAQMAAWVRLQETGILPPPAPPPATPAAPAPAAVVLGRDGDHVRVALDCHADAVSVARAVSGQWSRAQAGLAEILRFGAMLQAVQQWLEREDSAPDPDAGPAQQREGKWGGHNKGTGLKGWLSRNCPEVKYETARGYMAAAEGLRREARLAEDVPLLALMGDDPVPEARAEKLRQRILKVVAGSTLSLLREAARGGDAAALPPGGAREGAGRPAKAAPDPQADLEEAIREARRFLAHLRQWALEEDGLGALPDEVLEPWLTSAGDVVRRGRTILEGRRAAAKLRR